MKYAVESSDLIPVNELPYEGAKAVRRPQDDSSTCIVWETFDTAQANRHLIIKQIRPELYSNKRQRDCFIKEYNIGQRLISSYFPRYISLNDDGKSLSLTTEFIDGETLDNVLQDSPSYFRNKANFMHFLFQMLEALNDLHAAGIIHLDIKPQNIIITRRTHNVRIIDLGFSCTDDWQSTMGKNSAFASPEQQQGDVDSISTASDIYSLGRLMLYINKAAKCRLPGYVKTVLRKCAEDNLAKRYSSVQQILQDLDDGAQRHSKHTLKVTLITVATMSLLLLASYSFYQFWFEKEFDSNGFTYQVYYDDYFSSDELEIKSTVGDFNDSVLIIPNQVTHHGRTYAVRSIGDSCFMDCNQLRRVQLNDSLTTVHSFAFFRCANLSKVSMQKIVSFVDKAAFAQCDSLRTIDIDQRNPYLYMKDGAMFSYFNNYLVQCLSYKSGAYDVPEGTRIIQDYAFYNCTKLTSIHYPSSVWRILPNAMERCTSLTEFEFPKYVVDVENSVMAECHSLSSVTLSEDAVIIGWFSFQNCTNLKSITIPANVKRFSGECFKGCTNLRTVVNLSPIPQEIGDKVFPVYGDLYVPQKFVKAYKSAPVWKKFHIHALEEKE